VTAAAGPAPDDLGDWADEPPRRCRREFLTMLDVAAASSRQHGEIDEALRVIERAIEVEPLDEARYLELADLLDARGRRGSALGVLRRSRRRCGRWRLSHPPR
jgi:two-component SAPR family response regulator